MLQKYLSASQQPDRLHCLTQLTMKKIQYVLQTAIAASKRANAISPHKQSYKWSRKINKYGIDKVSLRGNQLL